MTLRLLRGVYMYVKTCRRLSDEFKVWVPLFFLSEFATSFVEETEFQTKVDVY